MSKKLVSGMVAMFGKTVRLTHVWNFGSGARLAVGAMMLAGTSAAMAAPIGVIDTFDDADLSQYTLTKVLDQNAGTSNISFSSPSGALSVQSTGTTGAEQVLFLRDDVSLGIGEQLMADVPAVIGSAPSYDRDFGIAVGFSETPSGLANGVAGDTRANFLEISRRSANEINFFAFRDNSSAGNYTTTNVFIERNDTPALSLFIARTSTNTFEAGFVQDGIRRVTGNATYSGAIVPGDAVGFYSDLRFDGTAPVSLDNLRIEAIPEPSSLAVLAAGGLLALRRRR